MDRYDSFRDSLSTVYGALLALAQNKEVQQRLRQEIVAFQGSGQGREPTHEELLTRLPYLDAVCKEA